MPVRPCGGTWSDPSLGLGMNMDRSERRALKTRPSMESLESRLVMSGGGPTDQQQYLLERINQVRTDPDQAAAWIEQTADFQLALTLRAFGENLEEAVDTIASRPEREPLAWSAELAEAAEAHALDMATGGFQSHTGSDGSSPRDRIDRTGFGAVRSEAENAYAYSRSVDHAMQAMLVDWGVPSKAHLNNLTEPHRNIDETFKEVGVAVVASRNPRVGPLVVTQQMARPHDAQTYLVGVVYHDRDGDDFYSEGEGQGRLRVEARSLADNTSTSVETWGSGGYQLALKPGDYQIRLFEGSRLLRDARITMTTQNQKVDFDLSEPAPPTIIEAPPEPAIVEASPEPIVVAEAPAVVQRSIPNLEPAVVPTPPSRNVSTLAWTSFRATQQESGINQTNQSEPTATSASTSEPDTPIVVHNTPEPIELVEPEPNTPPSPTVPQPTPRPEPVTVDAADDAETETSSPAIPGGFVWSVWSARSR